MIERRDNNEPVGRNTEVFCLDAIDRLIGVEHEHARHERTGIEPQAGGDDEREQPSRADSPQRARLLTANVPRPRVHEGKLRVSQRHCDKERENYLRVLTYRASTRRQLRPVVAGSIESFEARAKFSCFRLPKLTFQLCGSLGQPLYLRDARQRHERLALVALLVPGHHLVPAGSGLAPSSRAATRPTSGHPLRREASESRRPSSPRRR